MAVTLPDFASLGVVNPQPATAQPVYPQTSAVAEGEGKLGQGIEKAGGTIEDVAAYSQMARNRMDRAMADADFTGRIIPLTEQLKTETDPEKLTQLRGQFQDALDSAGQAIGDPAARQLWMSQQQKHVATGQAEADLRNTQVYRDRYKAGVIGQVADLSRTGAVASDPTAFALARDNIGHLMQSAQDAGALTAVEAENYGKAATKQLIEGRALNLVNGGNPAAAKAFLEQHTADLDPITSQNLQIRLENKADGIATDTAANRALGMAPRGGNSVDTTGTGEGHVAPKAERIAFAQQYAASKGINPDAVVATMAGEGLGKYVGDGGTSFGDFQLHVGGGMGDQAEAAGINIRDPNTWQAQTKFAIDQMAANRGAGAGWYAGQWHGAPAWAAQSFDTSGGPQVQPIPAGQASTPANAAQQPQQNRTGLPSLADLYNSIQADPTLSNDRQRDLAFNKAKVIYGAMEADAARSERIQTAQQKQALEQRTNEIYADVYSAQPKITASQIATDPAFNANPERRKAMIELINNPPGSGIPAAQSYAAAQSLIDRIRLPYGDPNKITTPDEVYSNIRSLNRPDLDFVLKTLDSSVSPGREKFNVREKAFLDGIKPQIDKSGIMPGLPNDGRGRLKFYEFQNALDGKVDQYIKAGKDPGDLLDPSKPDYMGKDEALKPYKRSMTQALADFQSEMGGGAADENKPPVSAVEITATGPNGQKAALRGGQWVDFQTGKPIGGEPQPQAPIR